MTQKLSQPRIILLDVLRIFSIFLVIFTHVAQNFHSPFGMFFGVKNFYFVSLGGVAVTLFIFLSGFVLELNYGNKKIEYLDFLKKRLSYIYPVYWVSLIVGVITFVITQGFSKLQLTFSNPLDIFQFLTGSYAFFGNWSGPFLGASWFIGLIILFYFLYPYLSHLNKKQPVLLFVSCLAVSVISRIVLGKFNIFPNRPLDWFPLCRLFEFYLGILLGSNKKLLLKLHFLDNSRFTQQITFLAELSFPAFLVHFPLLEMLRVLLPRFQLIPSICIYLAATAILSYLIVIISKIMTISILNIFKNINTKSIFSTIPNKIKSLYDDPLHRSSFFLMASTGVMAVVGFLFWIIASHFYTPAAIGIGGSLVSLTNLIEGIACLGLPITLIRFLPTSKNPDNKISTSLLLTGIMSLLVSVIFYFVSRQWMTDIFTLISSPAAWIVFTICVVIGTWQQIENSVFIAYNRTHWVFAESITYSIFKILLVFPFIYLQGFGIFIGQAGSLALAALISLGVQFQKYKINFFAGVTRPILQQLWKYSAISYFIGLMNGVPAQVLPAIVAGSLGAESAAHFFLALMMVSLITIIPQASSQTLFAAASATPHQMRVLTIKSLKAQLILIVAALLGLWILGGWVLSLFGSTYAQETTPILRILSLSIIPITIASPLNTRLRVKKQLKKLASITVLGAIAVVISCYLGSKYGLQGVAFGYVFGQIVVSILILADWKLQKISRLARG